MGISGIQLIITVVVMLGVAGLALLCDFLRARNATLQQTVTDLRGHNELKHAKRALEPLMKRPAAPVAFAATAPVELKVEEAVPAVAAAPASAAPEYVEKDIVRKPAPIIRKPVVATTKQTDSTVDASVDSSLVEMQRARDLAAEFTSRTGLRRTQPPAVVPAAKLENLNSKAVLEEWLNRRAAERAARNRTTTEKPQQPVEAPAAVAPEIPNVETPAVETAEVEPLVEPEAVAVVEAPVVEAPVVEAVVESPVVEMPVAESVGEFTEDVVAVFEMELVAETEPEIMIELTPEIELEGEFEHEVVAQVAAEPAAEAAAVEAAPEVVPELVVEAPAASRFGLPPVQIDAALWESLFGTKLEDSEAPEPEVQPLPSAAPETIFEVIRGAGSAGLVVPAGMHKRSALTRLLSSTKPFTGLVASVGINCQEGGAEPSEDLLQSIENHIASLLHENDFACRSGNDEFLMICPVADAGEAQRRLNHLSERLWDYQLRAIGTFSILFSSGGIHVQSEPLADAIAAADDRMRQTRRSRKAAFIDSVNQRRKAV
jgi:hypothetical protein